VTHYIVTDLGYGDAGKGAVVDWLCTHGGAEPVHTVVRFNGGAQAAHNVVGPGGRHHTFAQFGSGTFTAGVRTHLSRFMLVDPLALAAEAAHLGSLGVRGAFDRLTVDREALLTTPYHRAANQARERARGEFRHGSCGMGIGETARYALRHPADAPRAGDCAAPRTLARKLAALRDALADELGALDAPDVRAVTDAYLAFAGRVPLVDRGHLGRLLREGPAVFEGAQGVLLDEWHGFHPYTTWSTTTFANAEALLAEAGQAATRVGVIRCYMTRHGPGPFVTEDPALELPEPHNGRNTWQGEFRTGHFDAVALRYAIQAAGGADVIALTHLDVAARHQELRACHAYDISGVITERLPAGQPGDLDAQEALTGRLLRARPVYHDAGISDWPGYVTGALATPVALASHGPRSRDKRLLRSLAEPRVSVRHLRTGGSPGSSTAYGAALPSRP
jgi:adenylosuccinate synthase